MIKAVVSISSHFIRENGHTLQYHYYAVPQYLFGIMALLHAYVCVGTLSHAATPCRYCWNLHGGITKEDDKRQRQRQWQ
jgi:hypothetical protein